MTTVTIHETGCGLQIAQDGDTLIPLTSCCRVAAEHTSTCSACWRRVHEAYGFAAIVGSRTFVRDLRMMIEELTACEHPGDCAAEVAAKT